MTARQDGSSLSVRLDVSDLTSARAEHLARRLHALAVVTTVGLGWRSPADEPG